MDIIYKSPNGRLIIRGRKPESFLGFVFILAREAIEPVILASGLTIFLSRIQAVMERHPKDLWAAIVADSSEYPLIYWVFGTVLVVWIFYRAWKVRGEKIQERKLSDALDNISTALNRSNSELVDLKGTVVKMRWDALKFRGKQSGKGGVGDDL